MSSLFGIAERHSVEAEVKWGKIVNSNEAVDRMKNNVNAKYAMKLPTEEVEEIIKHAVDDEDIRNRAIKRKDTYAKIKAIEDLKMEDPKVKKILQSVKAETALLGAKHYEETLLQYSGMFYIMLMHVVDEHTIILSSNELMRLLAKAPYVLVEKTYKYVAKGFSQVSF